MKKGTAPWLRNIARQATDLKLNGSAATVREASHVVRWIINEALSEHEKSTK